MRLYVILVVPIAAVAAPAQPPAGPPVASPDPVVRWNEAALAAVRAERTPPPVAARNLAVLHVALYDAVALAGGGYVPFRSTARPAPGTDPATAAAVAAHRALVGLYPGRMREFDAVLEATLGPDGLAKDRGAASFGQAVAEQILAWRASDLKAAQESDYAPRPGLGRWRPTPPDRKAPLLPGWSNVPFFALTDPAAVRPPAPPDLASDAYVEAAGEVRRLGGKASTERTKDQTEVAHFWADGEGTVTPPGHWNRIAQAAVQSRKLNTAERARAFALLNVAMADAAIVCWECKFKFDLWRPVTAILPADPGWEPLLPTPPFPAYTSGHSSFSGAAAAALAAAFGTDEVAFDTTSDGLPGVTRSFGSFSAAAREAGMSRIYGGIHWQFDNQAGLACGNKIAEHAARHHFRRIAARPGNLLP
jgi:hypothetical protein